MPHLRAFKLLLLLIVVLGVFSAPVKADNSFRDCEECPEMVVIPAGNYGFGSPPNEFGGPYNEGYVIEVTFKEAFAIGKYEVTFDEWMHCVAAGVCAEIDDDGMGQGKHPVINVSWEDAVTYTQWLSKITGKNYRLPSEQEWEYAAQGPTKRARFFGIAPEKVCDFANAYDRTAEEKLAYGFKTVPCSDGFTELAEVGSFQPNYFGLHDMLGNVWEWVFDCLNPNWRFSKAATDGSPYTDGDCDQRAYRGGSWLSNQPYYLRTAERYKFFRTKHNDLGFRVARSMTE